jgi:hypothetical protein
MSGFDPRYAVIGKRFAKVAKVRAVTGGKGGIGKSLVASTHALNLARSGMRVGLLDLDFTGPCDHLVLGMKTGFPTEEFGIDPSLQHGIHFLSITHFVGDDPAPLRGRGLQQRHGGAARDHALGRARRARRGHAAGDRRRDARRGAAAAGAGVPGGVDAEPAGPGDGAADAALLEASLGVRAARGSSATWSMGTAPRSKQLAQGRSTSSGSVRCRGTWSLEAAMGDPERLADTDFARAALVSCACELEYVALLPG